jgi:hypothetical protein
MTMRESHQDVTLGEVYRLVESLKDDHGEKLDSINGHLRDVNGNLAKHSARLDVHDSAIQDSKRVRATAATVVVGDEAAITKRDLKLVIGVIGTLWALAQAGPPLIKIVGALASP